MIKIEQLLINDAKKKLVDISLSIENSLALVGESGSGKSLTLKAILGMIPKNLDYSLKMNSDFQRGKEISIVVQNPFTALSAMTNIDKHFEVDKKKKDELMKLVGLDKSYLKRYPSELSGGQLQRVVIALALEANPKLLLLDEPTTALDAKTKIDILNMIKTLQKDLKFKILYVTHDIESVRVLCDKIAIIKSGKIVENGKIVDILTNPSQEYTKSLIEANFKNRGFRS
ncbi:MAG TPA: ABC transporter ATP-binding protein [Campylobacterales bacterium]|nr:ABC transporter ATP-binding protein [Campylobacterales bacterium]